MPRPRIVVSEQRSHLTAAEKARKNRETELSMGDDSKVRRPPRALLTDEEAVKKWKYIVKVKQADKTLCNADFDNLVVYCNAWSDYLKAVGVMKTAGVDADLIMAGMRLEKQSTDLLYRYGARLGLDLNSRLKTAAVKVEKEQDAIDTRFGVI